MKKDHSWKAWGEKMDKRKGEIAKKMKPSPKVGEGKSHYSNKTYKN